MSDPSRARGADPTATVVIPVLNAASTIEAQLAALDSQEFAGALEVVVVDNGSQDATRAIAEGYEARTCTVRVIDEPNRGVNRARNAGVAAASSGFVLLCDADDVVHPGWVAAMSAAIGPGKFAAGAVDYETLNSERTRRIWAAPPVSTTRWTFGGNCGFTKSMWQEIGGFDPRLSGHGDETEMFERAAAAGYQQVYVPAALVAYRLRPGLSGMVRTRYRQGRSIVRTERRTGRPMGSVSDRSAPVLRLLRIVLSGPKWWVSPVRRYEWLGSLCRQIGVVVETARATSHPPRGS